MSEGPWDSMTPRVLMFRLLTRCSHSCHNTHKTDKAALLRCQASQEALGVVYTLSQLLQQDVTLLTW